MTIANELHGIETSAYPQTEPLGGQPAPGSKPSVPDLEAHFTYQRAFEALVWSQPAVGIYGIRRGMFAVGIKDNQIAAMPLPLVPRHEFLTANNNTPYIAANADLRNGPVVLEVPQASEKWIEGAIEKQKQKLASGNNPERRTRKT